MSAAVRPMVVSGSYVKARGSASSACATARWRHDWTSRSGATHSMIASPSCICCRMNTLPFSRIDEAMKRPLQRVSGLGGGSE